MENQNIKNSILKQPWLWIIILLVMVIILLTVFIFSNKSTNNKVSSENSVNPSIEQNQQSSSTENINSSVQGQQAGTQTKTTTQTPAKQQPVSLPQSNTVPVAPTQTTPTHVDGLVSIRLGGGVWENWNADIANDGPVLDIVYLDGSGNIITTNDAEYLPISADVSLYTTDTSTLNFKKARLVFSAHYTKEQIIFGSSLYPQIRIPKSQISVNPSVDYEFGYADITIHTPEQGDFSAEDSTMELYEK